MPRSNLVRYLALACMAAGLLNLVACSPLDGLAETHADSLEDVRDLQDEGRYAESLELLREMLDSEEVDAETHYLHGVALRRTGAPGLAIWSLEKASGTPEWELASNLELARAALSNHSFAMAIKATTHVLEIEPDHVGALSMRGEAYLGDRTQPEAALDDFERLLDLDPESVPARVQQASALLLLERTDEAEAAFDALLEMGGEDTKEPNPHFCIARATFSMERGMPDIAADGFNDCLERFPTEWTVVNESIRFFDTTGKPERSDEILFAALSEEPNSGAYRSAMAERMQARGEEADAESLLLAGTELDNTAAVRVAWTSLANFYLAGSNYQAATNAYEKAIEFGPEPGQQALLDFADLLSLSGQHDRALAIAEEFEQPLFRDLIHARVLLERDDPAGALQRLDSALVLWPNNAAARYYAALASERTGQFDRAVGEYRQAIRAGGGDTTDAPMRLARLLAADGLGRAALVAIGHRLKNHPNDPEAVLFALEIAQGLGDRSQIQRYLTLAQGNRTLWSKALRVSAEAVARRFEPGAAADALLKDPRFEFQNPIHAGPTYVLIEQLCRAGRTDEAEALLNSVASEARETPSLQAARGLILESGNAPLTAIRQTYQRALDGDPAEPTVLRGLARIEAQDGNLDGALDYYDRAAAAVPWDTTAARAAAKLLADRGQMNDAEERYERLLQEVPYDKDVATELARLRIARGADREAARELANRVLRFGDPKEAKRLIARIQALPASTRQASP